MATLRDIKRRIVSVKSTQQITNAMKMVAAAKLRGAQQRLFNARPYAEGLHKFLAHVAAQSGGPSHPLLEVRQPEATCYLVVTGDRGLCGSFNANVSRRTQSEVDACDGAQSARLIIFGRKGFEFFSRRGYDIVEKHINLFNELEFAHARTVSLSLQTRYLAGEFDRVYLVYNWFKSVGAHEVVVKQLLPFQPEMPESDKYELGDFIYEPSPKKILDEIIPKNLDIQVWRVLLESYAAEQAARMIAMGAASDNAQDMIHALTLHYNKVRQAAITTEISEIVAGAEALRG